MRSYSVILWLAVLSLPAYADDWTLTVSDADLVTLSNALGARPYNEVQALIAKLHTQIADQQTAKKKAADDPAQPKESK